MKAVLTVLLLLTAVPELTAQVPEWIWHATDGAKAPENSVRFFRRTFNCGYRPQKAELTCTADDEFMLYLNGRKIAEGTNWNTPVTLDVGPHMQKGQNVFAARVRNQVSDGGLLLKLELRSQNNSASFVVSDKNWTSSASESVDWQLPGFGASEEWKKVAVIAKLGAAPWGEVFEKPTATPAESLTVLPGFKAELLKSAERDEGSWICMTVDDKGRFIISPEKTEFPLLRITIGKDGQVSKTEKFAEPMRGAMGLLYAHGSLYVNGRGPQGGGLYRLIDRNKNDQFEPDEITFLKKFEGDNEHGYHAVMLGPDKMIYVINGNMSKQPEGLGPTSPHRNFQEDMLLPRMWDANGHAKDVLAPGGHVFRTDPEGKKWELLLGGFRNAYDADFSPEGELFTFDSDMEWDVGNPWYRPTRVNHCIIGGEYGWRSGSGKWPAYYPDSLPGTLDIGLSSPTGVKFGTASKFPPKYQKALYIQDWAYGKTFAVHLKPHGASYTGTFETFISGKPLAVVDLEFGKDGAMYFIIGGWKIQSGLYRVSYVGEPQKEERLSSADKKLEKEAAKQRGIRRKLESFHGKTDPRAISFAWHYLNSDDRWLRFPARVAVERQDVSLWEKRALVESKPTAAINGLLALARSGDASHQPRLLERLNSLLQQPLTIEQQLELLRAYQVCFIRMGKPEPRLAQSIAAILSSRFPAQGESLNRELAQLLVYLEAPDVVAKTLVLMESVPTQEEQMWYAYVLRHATNGWTLEHRKTYFEWFNKALAEYSGGNSFDKYLVNIRSEALEKLNKAERSEVASIVDKPVVPQVPAVDVVRQFVKEWKFEELTPDLELVDTGRSFLRGKEAFITQCAPCHRMGKLGISAAPELTGVSGRFGRRDILEHIISPSKVISDRFQNITVTTKDDEEFTGCITEETDQKLVLITNLATNQRQEIAKGNIQSRRTSELSPMPEALLDVLTKEDIFDLLAYLEADGKNGSAAFVQR